MGTKFYAASTSGFYDADIHGHNMPADARSISDETYTELMDAQAGGKEIRGTDEGPVSADRPPPSVEQLAAAARARRSQLLTASDWTQMRDVADATAAAWAPYRQALRDVPNQDGFPASIDWPEAPL